MTEDLDVERALLGCFLMWNSTFCPIPAEDWSVEVHRSVYLTCEGLLKAQGGFDTLTVLDALQGANMLESVGGAAYLSQLTSGVMKSMAPRYASIVKSKAKLRRLAKLLESAQEQAESGVELNDILRELEIGLRSFRESK